MRLSLLCKAQWESRVDRTLRELDDSRFNRFLESQDYGSGLDCIAVFFVCLDPSPDLKQEIELKREKSFYRDERILYMDIMLDLPTMRGFSVVDFASRRQIVAQRLAKCEILSRFDVADFRDREAFVRTFAPGFLGWIEIRSSAKRNGVVQRCLAHSSERLRGPPSNLFRGDIRVFRR